MIPEWLLHEQNYKPQIDKDTFINKSILGLIGIISRIKAEGNEGKDLFRMNSAFKVAFTFMLIVLLSLSASFTFVVVAGVYLLAVLSMMEAREIVKIIKISLIMTIFTFVILLPAAIWGNYYSSVMITSKVFVTVMAVNILSHSTKWGDITSGLKRFFVPSLFILVLDITIKYIVLLGEFSLQLLYALKLRSVGKNKSKYTSLSGVAGTLFIKSKEMAEEMYSAMECRGFTGEYSTHKKFVFTYLDFIYIIINIGLLFAFVYLGRV